MLDAMETFNRDVCDTKEWMTSLGEDSVNVGSQGGHSSTRIGNDRCKVGLNATMMLHTMKEIESPE